MNVQDRIRQQVEGNAIILYMKGTPDFPQCGFSGRAVNLLRACRTRAVTFDPATPLPVKLSNKVWRAWRNSFPSIRDPGANPV
jgi:monothiol glutaredoxin